LIKVAKFHRAGGATFVGPALQHWVNGKQEPTSPIGAAQTATIGIKKSVYAIAPQPATETKRLLIDKEVDLTYSAS
jgi:hypothetical protein